MTKTVLSAIIVAICLLLDCSLGLCGEPADPGRSRASDSPAIADDGENGLVPDLLQRTSDLTEREKRILGELRESLRESNEEEDFDIPIVINAAVNQQIKCFTGTRRDVVARWLVRAEKYAPTIRDILKKNGLPEDLVYLAMIESGFNMKALSPAAASGPWQFIRETGQRYGLRVDYWVDERHDLEKSTVAAARYLKKLFDEFGCWYLAAAGYNAGEHRVERAIEKHDTTDFWRLRKGKALPKETAEYVPQLIAAALIAKNPEKYGFTDIDSSQVYRLGKISVPGGINLKRIARALSLETAELQALNPELLRGITPPDRKEYQIKIPGTADIDIAARSLEAELHNGRQVVGVIKHQVKKRETLPQLLKRYEVTHSDLALVNGNGQNVRIPKGGLLYVPRFEPMRKDAVVAGSANDGADRSGNGTLTAASDLSRNDEDDDVVVSLGEEKGAGKKLSKSTRAPKSRLASHTVAKSDRGEFYKVRKGDSLALIAERRGISVAGLMRINGLKGSKAASIKPGMRLRVD